MNIRCPSCSKLFRVADEKIAGKGIRFKCSKCAEVVTITKDDFEMDLLARKAETGVPAAQSSIPTPKPVSPPPPMPPTQQPKAEEYKPQESRPPVDQPANEQPAEDQQIPPVSMGDFDFSEPHAAATSAAHPTEGFGGPDFTFDATQEQVASEIEISPEAAAEAEAAFRFPDGLLAEPKRKPAFGAPSLEGQAPKLDLGSEPEPELKADLEAGPEPQAIPELKMQPTPIRDEPLETGPVLTAPPLQEPASQPQQDSHEEIDHGVASSIPQSVGTGESFAGKEREEKLTARTVAASVQDEVHPLASGNVTGAVAGLGCAVPIVALLFLSAGIVMALVPFFASASLFHIIALVGSGIISMSVLIGLAISIVQAKAGKKLFFLVNVLIGTVFGAGFGVVESLMISLASRAGLNVQQLIANAILSAAAAFVLSILVVVARRILINEKAETLSADLSGLQKAGLVASLVLVLFAFYETGTITGRMEQSLQEPGQEHGDMLIPTGLQVSNAHGYIDPATGDLIVSGLIQNTTDKPKIGWYLVTEIRDAKESVLTTVKMMNGIQLYTAREREFLAKRGTKKEDIQKMSAVRDGMIPARGSVNFEVRVMNPPAGSTGFLPTLRAYDPSSPEEGR
jgi:predicted Zn finger-like uncharacterized protein